jgi:hypothetical protein
MTIAGTGALSLTSDTLYLTVGSQSYIYDLYNLSVFSLAEQINTVTPTALIQNGIVELLTLENGQSSTNLPATLYLPSDNLYILIGMIARSKEGRRRSLNKQIAQMNLQASTGRILDMWGASCNLPRYDGEPDSLYSQRLTGMRFRRTQNTYSIERLLKTLGYIVTVTTNAPPGSFSIDIQIPTTPPNGFVYSLGQIADIVGKVKSATYQAIVTVSADLADNIITSDTLSITLNPKTWVVGEFTVGQFIV